MRNSYDVIEIDKVRSRLNGHHFEYIAIFSFPRIFYLCLSSWTKKMSNIISENISDKYHFDNIISLSYLEYCFTEFI